MQHRITKSSFYIDLLLRSWHTNSPAFVDT